MTRLEKATMAAAAVSYAVVVMVAGYGLATVIFNF